MTNIKAYENIISRRSVRRYTEKPVSDETMRLILQAAMNAPSCVNARDWSFIVIRDRKTLNRMADGNGGAAEPLRHAAAGILVCGDLSRSFPPAKDYWIIDASIAAENIVLAAHALSLGSVWLGTWPQMERVDAQRALFGLPENIIPHSIIALGYPAEAVQPKDGYEADRVHFEKW